MLRWQVNATDIDSEEFGNVSYEVFPESSLFSVSRLYSGEGEIRVEGLLDRETVNQYTITLLARDGGTVHKIQFLSTTLDLLINTSIKI